MFDSMAAFKFDVILVWKEWIIDSNQELSQERRKSLLNCSLSFDDLEKLTIEFSSRRIKSGLSVISHGRIEQKQGRNGAGLACHICGS